MDDLTTAWDQRVESLDPVGHVTPVVAGADLRSYLAPRSGSGPVVPTSSLIGRARRVLGPRQRAAVKIAGTRLLAPRSVRQFRSLLAGGAPLLLNLGSGTYNAPGWVNVDLWGLHRSWGVDPDVIWDLRRPLPLPDGSVRGVFLEHVLEHLPAPVGLAAADQAFRLLEPGGVLRISVPDFGRYACSYADRVRGRGHASDLISTERPGRPTELMAVAEVVYDHGHVSVWDADTLIALMRAAGFVDVHECGFGSGTMQPVPDSPARRGESLYVEGTRTA